MLNFKMYVFAFLYLAICCWHDNLLAQSQNSVDSLRTQLSKSELNSDKVKTLNDLANELASKNTEEALLFATRALDLANEIEDLDGILAAYSNLGRVKTYSGDYDEALENLFDGLQLSDSFDNDYYKARILNNIGNTYWKAGKRENAYQYYKQSLSIRKNIGDSLGMAKAYGNLGNIANSILKDLDSAEYYYQNALDLFIRLKDSTSISITFINLGNIEKANGKKQEALKFYHKSLSIDLNKRDYYGASYALSNIGNSHKELNQNDSAFFYFHALLNTAHKIESLFRKRQAFQRLAYLHKELGRFDSAFYYLEKFQVANDSLIDERTQTRMAKLESEYENDVQTKQLEILKTQNELDNEQLNNQYWQNLFLIFLVLFLIAGVVILVIRNKEKSKLNLQLSTRQKALEDKTWELQDAKKLIEESHQELLTLNDSLESKVALRTQELNESYQNLLITKERLNHFTYRSAHDLKGPIASILGMCNLMKKDIELITGNQDRAINYVDLILDTAKSMNELLKRILKSNQLNESILKFEDTPIAFLLEELKEIFQESAEKNNVQLLINVEDNINVNTDPTILKVILKYILKNSFQHIDIEQSKPMIEIVVEQSTDNEIKIHIKDNGTGVEPELVPNLFKMFSKGSQNSKNTGLGLYDVNLLAEKIGAKVYFDQCDQDYTHFVIALQ